MTMQQPAGAVSSETKRKSIKTVVVSLVSTLCWLVFAFSYASDITITAIPTDPMWRLITRYETMMIESSAPSNGIAIAAQHENETLFVRPLQVTQGATGAHALQVSVGILLTPVALHCSEELTVFATSNLDHPDLSSAMTVTSCLRHAPATRIEPIGLLPPRTSVTPVMNEWQPIYALDIVRTDERPDRLNLNSPILFYIIIFEEVRFEPDQLPSVPTHDTINKTQLRHLAPQP